jgi:hypothetical protein
MTTPSTMWTRPKKLWEFSERLVDLLKRLVSFGDDGEPLKILVTGQVVGIQYSFFSKKGCYNQTDCRI